MEKESAPRTPKAPTPGQLRAQQFLQTNPASADNLIKMYDSLSETQHKQGRNWYPSANYIAHQIAQNATENTGRAVNADQVAGHIANYSGQTQWHNNMHMAWLAAHGIYPGEHGAGWRSPIDGKGFMATAKQAEISKKINAGEDWRKLLSPVKEGSFGQNISAGGTGKPIHVTEGAPDLQSRDGRIHLTTDRHHVSAAHGGYADEDVYKSLGLNKPENYDRYTDMTVEAANKINARDPSAPPVHPVGLQAEVWLGQQAANAANGYTDPKAAQRSIKSAASNKARFEGIMEQHGLGHINERAPVVGFPGTGGAIALDHDGEIPVVPTYHGMPAHDGRPVDVGPTAEHSKSPNQHSVQQQNAMNKALIQAGMKPNTIKGVPFDEAHGGKHINDYLALATQHGGYDSSHVQASGGQVFPHFHDTPVGQSSLAALQQAGMPFPHRETNEVAKLPSAPVAQPLVAFIRRSEVKPGVGGFAADLVEKLIPEKDEEEEKQPQQYFLSVRQGNIVRSSAPRHLNPANPGGPQWQPQDASGETSVRTPQGIGGYYDNIEDNKAEFPIDGGAHLYEKPNANNWNNYKDEPTARAEIEKQLVDPSISKGRHHAASATFQYDPVSDQFKTSNLDAKFACNCGREFHPQGMMKCVCGKTWTAFDIIPADKTANRITRIIRSVPEHRERILAKKITKNSLGLNPTNHDDSDSKVNNGDYQSADATNQQPDRTQSVEIKNDKTQGVIPTHDTSLPFFTRTDHSDDAAPVVFDKESSMSNFYVRSNRPFDELPYQDSLNTPSLSDLPKRDFKPQIKNDLTPDKNFPATGWPGDELVPGNTHPNVRKADMGHPVVPRHLNPENPGGPQWNPTGTNSEQVTAPFGQAAINNNYGMGQVAGPGIGGGHKVIDPLANGANLPAGGLKNELENNLAFDTGSHHAESPGRHRAKKEKMEFNEQDFRLGFLHAENDGGLPDRTASRSFLEGYIAALTEVTADRAPGWDTVAPAFEKDPHPTSSDFQDRTPMTDDGDYKGVRQDFIRKEDKNNEAGQSRDDQGQGINRPTTDLEGWKDKVSSIPTAALAREIARRSNA